MPLGSFSLSPDVPTFPPTGPALASEAAPRTARTHLDASVASLAQVPTVEMRPGASMSDLKSSRATGQKFDTGSGVLPHDPTI